MSFTKHPLLHYKSMNRIIPKMASSKRLINYQYTRGATAIDAINLKVKLSKFPFTISFHLEILQFVLAQLSLLLNFQVVFHMTLMRPSEETFCTVNLSSKNLTSHIKSFGAPTAMLKSRALSVLLTNLYLKPQFGVY